MEFPTFFHERRREVLFFIEKAVLAGYLSKRETLGSRIFRKKLTEVLRRHWSEGKDILSMLKVASIKVGRADVSAKDLFGSEASLEEMEEQVSAVKTTVGQIESEDVDRKVKQLMLQEQEHRARIEKLCIGKRVRKNNEFIPTSKVN